MSALSKRLVDDDLKRGTLKIVRLEGWPRHRTIRIVRLKNAFESKAVRHFLQLARKRLRKATFVDPDGAPSR